MSQTFASGKSLMLTKKLNPGDTSFLANTDIGVTKGRIFFTNGAQKEWVQFTGVSTSGSNFEYTGLTRQLSQTSQPATSLGTGYTWIGGTIGVLVEMHDQMGDKNEPEQYHQEALTFATTTARDTALGGDGVCTFNYTDVKCTDTGLFYNYNTSSNQWEIQGTGTATPNASTTVSGSVEIATQTETDNGDETGGTGAILGVPPRELGRSNQKQSHLKGTSTTGNDTYVITLTPAPTAYVEGMEILIKPDTANTGACSVNINSLGAKNIKGTDGADPKDGEIGNTTYTRLRYDGTNFVIIDSKRATSAEALTGTDSKKYMTPSTTKDSIKDSIGTAVSKSSGTNYQATESGFVVATSDGATNNGAVDNIYGYVGNSNPASTLIAGNRSKADSTDISYVSICFPVKKGQWYRVDTASSGATTFTIYFIPNA